MLWWGATAGAAAVAVLAGIGDWRRRSRRDLDKIGWVNWVSLQMFALLAAISCAIMAMHS